MVTSVKQNVHRVLRWSGYDVVRCLKPATVYPSDFDDATITLWEQIKPFTLTSPERLFALRHAVRHISRFNIPGDIVECGVWRGGSMMAVAKTLIELGVIDRKLCLFDTYEGMSAPTELDTDRLGRSAVDLLSRSDKATSCFWARCSLEEVQHNMWTTGYPRDNISFIRGKVEDTLPARAPSKVALLRLDTDWYESTYHELVHLYPALSPGGLLIVDDYGHWTGARRAVDQYFAEHNCEVFLNRIDFTGRLCIKIG